MKARRRELVIVSNRLPVRRMRRGGQVYFESSTGGLVTGLRPVMAEMGGTWIGWSGSADWSPRKMQFNGTTLKSVRLSGAEIEAFYQGFCNRTIWPLYHDAIRIPQFENSWWKPFVTVNGRFARAAAQAAGPSDTVWIHDYHLQLAPSILRRLRPELRIGFFLHIPFPPEALFARLPWRRDIVSGMLGADVIGFQTPEDARSFSRAARRFTGATGTDRELRLDGRSARVGHFPISVDFKQFEALASTPGVLARAREIRRQLGAGRKLMLSIDRLDYSKGIDQRLLAYEELLRRRLATVDNCVLMQVAVPSRERVREYDEIRNRVERIVGRINGQFGVPGRVAVHYFRRSVPQEEYLAYYRAADVMLVTPLKDGMNLVAKEYVSTRVDATGVLVLSEFAGAARELREALLVNPHDIESMVHSMVEALNMPPEEAGRRMAALRSVVRRHDVHDWAADFLGALHGRPRN